MSYTDNRTSIVDERTTKPGRSGRRPMSLAERIAAVAGLSGVIVMLGAWLFPFSPTNGPSAAGNSPTTAVSSMPSPTVATTTPDPTTTRTADAGSAAPPTPSGVPDEVVYLSGLAPQSGGANLTVLPRTLRGQPGYQHAVVIACPTNQSDDKERSVTYLLRGRYLDLSGTAVPAFSGDREATARVTVLTGLRERDDTMTWREQTARNSTMDKPAGVTAEVAGAEELTLRVQCSHPEGVVVLADIRLTRV